MQFTRINIQSARKVANLSRGQSTCGFLGKNITHRPVELAPKFSLFHRRSLIWIGPCFDQYVAPGPSP